MNFESTIKTSNLSIGYKKGKKKSVVLEGINIELCGGELVCLLGVNGSGKSTLIRTISGFQPPLEGSVSINGKELDDYSRLNLAQKISVVLTDRVSGTNLNVYDLVSLGRYPYTNWFVSLSENDQKAIDHAIELAGINDLLQRKIYELSDGQLQKCMIARALAQDGPIMILDEPTTHLDLNNRVEIMRLLRTLAHNQDKTILVATHELDLALQMADSFLLISSEGILKGMPEDLILSGALDNVFQLKGYDLKSGRAVFLPTKKLRIVVEGDGYCKLWTKNALERNGFNVDENRHDLVLKVSESDNKSCKWSINWSGKQQIFLSVSELIAFLLSINSKLNK